MSPKSLGVWLDGRRVATLQARKPWDLRCRYEVDAIDTGNAGRPLLSCSLPLSRRAMPATPWVRGLLPEGAHLLALALRAKVPTNFYADLLQRYGRDIAGAFSISEQAPEPRRWAVEPYEDAELVAELREVASAPGFAVRDDSELSIAGIQNKLLVVALPQGRWGRPRNGHPSTHIMKLSDGRFPGMLAAEHACMRIARAVGLTSVVTELATFDEIEVLIVQRYDRRIDPANGVVGRLHQEDSCQALGVDIDASGGRGKYERFGGPSFAQIAMLLDRYGDLGDQQRLLRVMLFTTIIGNADGHGKNISFLLDTETGAVHLAPLYDTVPTALWPGLRAAPAMSVNGAFGAPAVGDALAEAGRWGLGANVASDVLEGFLVDVQSALTACEDPAVAELVRANLDRLAKTR